MTKSAPNARATALDWAHVDDLRPNPRNPRRHGQEVMRLARSILRTAWGAPIVAQRSTKRIIGGHGRLEAAKEILAGIEVDGELRGGHEHLFDKHAPAPGMVPVRWVDVSDAEADAMTLADNARALQGVDDPLAIVEMAQQFGRESETMRDIGFDAATLDAIVKSAGDAIIAGDAKEVDVREERKAELVEKWSTSVGQLWIVPFAHGEHLLICGDSLDSSVRERLKSRVKADVVFSDPPYDMPAKTQVDTCFSLSDCAVISGCGPEYARIAGIEGVRFWYEVISLRTMPRSMPRWPGPFVMHWQNAFITRGGEHLFHRKHARGRFGNGDYFPSVRGPYKCGEHDHGHSKPVEWAAELLSMMPARVVCDPFCGSGTTLVAAEQIGQVGAGIEIDPGFVAITLERLSLLGLEPRLADA